MCIANPCLNASFVMQWLNSNAIEQHFLWLPHCISMELMQDYGFVVNRKHLLSIHLVAMVMDEDTGWSHAAEESKPQCN